MSYQLLILRTNTCVRCREVLNIFLILVLVSVQLSSQDQLIDKLNNDLADTIRIDVLGDLATQYFNIDLDSSITFSDQAIALAVEIEDREREAYMRKNMGIAYYYKGEHLKVLEYWNASLAIFQDIDHPVGESNLLSNLGGVYNQTGDYLKAIENHLLSLRIAVGNNDSTRQATVYQNLGATYSNMKEYDKSEEYYIKALDLCETIKYDKCVGLVNMNLSEVARERNKFEASREYLQTAEEIFRTNNFPEITEALIGMSMLSVKEGNFRQALDESEEARKLVNSRNISAFLSRTYITEAQAWYGLGEYKKAVDSYQKSFDTDNNLGVTVDQQEAYNGIVKSYQDLGDYKNASLAQNKLISINNELYNKDKNNSISNLELKYDIDKQSNQIALLNSDIENSRLQRNLLLSSSAFLSLILASIGFLYINNRKKNKIIEEEKNKSDALLKNILPPQTAEELKEHGSVEPKRYDSATVLFTDFVGFTTVASDNTAETIVSSIDYYFREFDRIVERYGLEKIKTIGDAYMCAGGLNQQHTDKFEVMKNTLQAGIDMLEFTKQTEQNNPIGIAPFKIRIGIHGGPVVAGVVGQSKFQYDIWGNTVNVAHRMESNSSPNKINVSENVYDLLNGTAQFEYRGEIEAKHAKKLKMYYLEN